MSREAAALTDLFLLLFLLAVLNVGQRSPWEGEPLRAETAGVRTQSVDPGAVEVSVTHEGYNANGVRSSTPEQVIASLGPAPAYVVLLGDGDAGYARYEALERALQAADIRYVRHVVLEEEVLP